MRRWWSLGAALFAPALSALAACPEPASQASVREAVAAADAAFRSANADAYRAADDDTRRRLLCVDSLVSPELAAAVHRTGGVRAFLDRDLERAEIRFAAARRLDPEFDWEVDLVPRGHPLRTTFVAQDPDRIATRPVPRPREGFVAFDGLLGSGRPVGVPTVFQLLDIDGRPTTTALLEPYQEVPTYPSDSGRRGIRPASIVAIVGAITAASLYGGALASRATYDDLDTPYDKLDGLRTRIAGLTIASAGTAAVSLGAGVVAVMPTDGR